MFVCANTNKRAEQYDFLFYLCLSEKIVHIYKQLHILGTVPNRNIAPASDENKESERERKKEMTMNETRIYRG